MIKVSKEEYERRMKFAREKVAQIWCIEKIKNKVMEAELAEEFAKILVVEMYKPYLGCATTRELLNEIAARVDLEYKTITDVEQTFLEQTFLEQTFLEQELQQNK